MFGLGNVHAPPQWLSVAEAREWLKISDRRVRALLAAGALEGRLSPSGAWDVDRLSVVARLEQEPRPVRPLAQGGVRLLADAIALALGERPSPAWGDAVSRDRARAMDRLARLSGDPDPVGLVRAWVRVRRDVQGRRCVQIPADVSLLDVPGVRLSGVSHPLVRLDPVGEIEVHVRAVEGVEVLERKSQSSCGLVVAWMHRSDDWSVGDVVFDLIEHEKARENGDAQRLLCAAAVSVPVAA